MDNHDDLAVERLINCLTGELELTDDIFLAANSALRSRDRSYVYRQLNAIPFHTPVYVTRAILVNRDHRDYYHIDSRGLVRRKLSVTVGADDDVYVPCCNIGPLLAPHRTLEGYGILDPKFAATIKDPASRIAITFAKSATVQARQVKDDITRFLQALLLMNGKQAIVGDEYADRSPTPPCETCPALHAVSQVIQLLGFAPPNLSPFLALPAGGLWHMPGTAKVMPVQVPQLLNDLVNLAILRVMLRIPDELTYFGVRVLLAAAYSESYSWAVLQCKHFFPDLSVHAMYKTNFSGGYAPIFDWPSPRSDYRFTYLGHRTMTSEDKPVLPLDLKKVDETARKFDLVDVAERMKTYLADINTHTHASMKYAHHVMALTSSSFTVQTATESVYAEYTQNPVIEQPIPPDSWTGPIGYLRLLKTDAPAPALSLHRTWRNAAVAVAKDMRQMDPLQQAIMRTQYVTPRGGSGYSLRTSLEAANVAIRDFRNAGVKISTKIYQAAQTAQIPFEVLLPAVLAAVTLGTRFQVQRRPRAIMPLNIVQQTVSAIHTIVADYINKHMNLSTTSGSAVQEKVIPLVLFASTTPTTVVNVDVKACDACVTYSYFLSVICAAMYEGLNPHGDPRPFMGVPVLPYTNRVSSAMMTDEASGMQVMVQQLARLYQNGFRYMVSDPMAPGNIFELPTLTFPSGSTATSTEHTANNSTMMDHFITTWLPEHTTNPELKAIVRQMSIRDNYVCQGDDGMCIIDNVSGRRISAESLTEFTTLLNKYGRQFGWVYDIDASGCAEYLKIYAVNGCRVPNCSRHPILGKEMANPDAYDPWPQIINALMGLWRSGLTDAYDTVDWTRYMWALVTIYASGSMTTTKGQRLRLAYPMSTFITLGIPPIRIWGCDPFTVSVYMPPGDMGVYALINVLRHHLYTTIAAHGDKYRQDRGDDMFDGHNVLQFLHDTRFTHGYFAAAHHRVPLRESREVDAKARLDMISALSDFLYHDPELRFRVIAGRRLWDTYGQGQHGAYLHRVPSLDDVPHRWYEEAREADRATLSDEERLFKSLHRAITRPSLMLSKLLMAYLRVRWDIGELMPAAVSPQVPLTAGMHPQNPDMFMKMTSLGPFLERVGQYFHDALFVKRVVSGMDVNTLDAALLKLRILGAPANALVGVIMQSGFSESEAAEIAGRIQLKDARTVQIARVVNLSVPDTWMLFNFHLLLHATVNPHGMYGQTTFTKIPPSMPWLRSILLFLGSSINMTRVGPIHQVYLARIHGTGASLARQFQQWMSSAHK
ncbi:VP2 [Reovirus GCRV104]|nr:VP2 [Reovirus GCRV104]